MNTDLRKIITGIQKIKMTIPDIYEKPRVLFSYLFDYFPDEEELLVKYAPAMWFFPMLVEIIDDFYSYMCYTERKIFLLGRRYIWMNLLNF